MWSIIVAIHDAQNELGKATRVLQIVTIIVRQKRTDRWHEEIHLL